MIGLGFIVERLLHYVAANTLNHPNYERQVEFYKKHQTFFEEDKYVDMFCCPEDFTDYDLYNDYFDTIFTSPPYFDVEKYSDEDTQSYKRYKTIDSWNKNFLHETLRLIIPTLKENGILKICSDVYHESVKGYVDITNAYE